MASRKRAAAKVGARRTKKEEAPAVVVSPKSGLLEELGLTKEEVKELKETLSAYLLSAADRNAATADFFRAATPVVRALGITNYHRDLLNQWFGLTLKRARNVVKKELGQQITKEDVSTDVPQLPPQPPMKDEKTRPVRRGGRDRPLVQNLGEKLAPVLEKLTKAEKSAES